ncbi:hypothetical protein NE237_028094 [Protea cynaroides]|uniref:Uncharacterized protein n=1 Tax=Protea cynaroides TaxID=273540 RepID=A0A9Q0GNP0_9MAGN|nr:hypothetical protein NE237_028094 [Protea cynaroides]
MEATFSSLYSPFLPPGPSSSSSAGSRHRKWEGFRQLKVPNQGVFATRRDGYNWGFDGRLVDESMIVLRRRIHKMKMVERNYEPLDHWMEWERTHGMLLSQLMNTWPSLALGMLTLVGCNVFTFIDESANQRKMKNKNLPWFKYKTSNPTFTSTILIILHLMNVAIGILFAGIHLIN